MKTVALTRWHGVTEVSELFMRSQADQGRAFIQSYLQDVADRAAREQRMISGTVEWKLIEPDDPLTWRHPVRPGFRLVWCDAFCAPRSAGITRELIDLRQGHLVMVPDRGAG